MTALVVHLVDGTYELFRHFHGGQRFARGPGAPLAAVAGVLHTVLELLEQGATHVGVATDHVVESFRNDLWPGYKTGVGIDGALLAQFHPLEEALVAMGVTTWPMVELEADDALASAATLADADAAVAKVCVWSPDKDLAQCVRGERVVQIDRRAKAIRGAAAVRAKYGVVPERIPDWLALCGDAADGYPGIRGIGAVGAARLVERHGPIERVPASVLGPADREAALLFKRLATLRTDVPVVDDVAALRWRGPTEAFVAWCERLAAPRLLQRALAVRPLLAYDPRVLTGDLMATSKKATAKKATAKKATAKSAAKKAAKKAPAKKATAKKEIPKKSTAKKATAKKAPAKKASAKKAPAKKASAKKASAKKMPAKKAAAGNASRKTAPAKKAAAKKSTAKSATAKKTSPAKKASTAKTPARKRAAKRELVAPNSDKRFVRRDDEGQFKESDDVGRSLAQDVRKSAENEAGSGQGDKGDHPG